MNSHKLSSRYILLSILATLFSYLLSFTGFDRDIDLYLKLSTDCGVEIPEFGFFKIIDFFNTISCLSSPLPLLIVFVFLSVASFYIIISTLFLLLSPYLVIPLVFNPLSLSWFFFPSKESFFILGTFLILSTVRNIYASVSLKIFSSFILFLIRPFLILYILYLLSSMYLKNTFLARLLKGRLSLSSLTLFLPLVIIFTILFLPLLDSFLVAALRGSSALTDKGFANMLTFQTDNFAISLIVNTPIIFFFSFFSRTALTPIYILFNLFILRLFFVIYRDSRSFAPLLLSISYVLPYASTLVNAGTAFRVLETSVILSSIFYTSKFSANIEAHSFEAVE